MPQEPLAPDLATLVAQHHADLYRYGYRLTGRTADAEDLTQQTFLQAQAHLDQLRDPACARSWLFTILRNCYQKSHRQRQRIRLEPAAVDVDQIPDSAGESPVDGEQLQQALDQLPDEFKSVLLMFYFEQSSYREIADRLNLPVGTVMSRLSRAKGHLRAKLLDAGALSSSNAEQPAFQDRDSTDHISQNGDHRDNGAALPESRETWTTKKA